MKNLATVINVSAPDEIVINKGKLEMSVGQKVNLIDAETEISKGIGEVFIVHKKISVIRSDNFKNPQVNDLVR